MGLYYDEKQETQQMLRFQNHPDNIFMAILTGSMEIMIDQIRESLAVHRKNDAGAAPLEFLMPNAAGVFVPETALTTLKKMLRYHAGPGLYYLNDYHYLLLYDTLDFFCTIHNDMVRIASNVREKNKASRIAGVHVEKINFDNLIAMYFYDTDFLLDANTMINLGLDKRKVLGVHEETFGISQGLAPHPEELRFRLVKEEIPELRVTSQFWGFNSKVYPDLSAVE